MAPQMVNITAQYFYLEVILCIMFPLDDSILLSSVNDVPCVAIALSPCIEMGNRCKAKESCKHQDTHANNLQENSGWVYRMATRLMDSPSFGQLLKIVTFTMKTYSWTCLLVCKQ
jgi:hypothetical protein